MLSRIRFYSLSSFLLNVMISLVSLQIHCTDALQSTIRKSPTSTQHLTTTSRGNQLFSTSTTIFYRDNNDEASSYLDDTTTTTSTKTSFSNQKLQQQLQVEDDEELTNASTLPTSLSSVPVSTNYNNNIIQQQQQQSKQPKWLIWSSTIIRMQGRSSSSSEHDDAPGTMNKKQSEVDAYLTFLDRRYHRLRDDESTAVPSKTKSVVAAVPVLKKVLLTKESIVSTTTSKKTKPTSFDICKNRKEEENDALCVLGVAKLASKELLQKHHLTIPVSSSTAAVSPSSNRMAMMFVPFLRIVVILIHTVSVQRQRFMDTQTNHVQTVVRYLQQRTTVGQGGETAKKLWSMGGGPKNIRWTMTILSALVYILIQPLMALGSGSRNGISGNHPTAL